MEFVYGMLGRDIYGFSNILTSDNGSLFTSEMFNSSCLSFGIIQKEIPIESHNSLGQGERYHSPLEKICSKVKLDYPSLSNQTALTVSVYGLNNSVNMEGLIPTLLVFGTIPKLPLGNTSQLQPDQKERFFAMGAAK